MTLQAILEILYQPPEQVFAAFAGETGAVFFDSSTLKHPLARFSMIAFDPVKIVTHLNDIPSALEGYSFQDNPPLPFTGGLAGFFSYDLGRELENLPKIADASDDFPALRLGLYDQVIGFDHALRRAWYCSYGRTPWHELEARLAAYKLPAASGTLGWSPRKSRTEYQRDIQTAIDYILEGDIFQVNLAQRFEAAVPQGFDPYAHYLNLRHINPAPFSAYLNFGDTVIASSSPERFLNLRGPYVETRPIKGTHHDAAALAASEKDRAENIMIVDLLRNDLSKVCTPVSVEVHELCAIESYEGLHHLVSSVTGTLDKDETALSLLKACFPGGSITGAPKIRAMEIIEELEPTRRGPYCGSIGYIGFNGCMDTNIAIRSVVYKNGRAFCSAGGGITAASDPATEYDETLLKAHKIFESYR